MLAYVCVCVCVCVQSISPADAHTHTQELPHCLCLSIAVFKSICYNFELVYMVHLSEGASTVGKCENKNGKRSNLIYILCGIAVISLE